MINDKNDTMINDKINVTADNIFPIIKKFLYSDHEIFLRELVSNATDAILKLKTLSHIGELKQDQNILHPKIEIKINKNTKTLHVIDEGIGMTKEEVEKYINQIAFSGAEEFIEKYKDKSNTANSIIGHFGLGFYSSFMVADKVEILTKSYLDTPGVYWSCNGSPNFQLKIIDKKEIGTEIILYINNDNQEFITESRIRELLNKYCKFMPIPIKFGEKEKINTTDNKEELRDGNKEEEISKKEISKVMIDDIINNTSPAWIMKPIELKNEDYLNFYRELYPMQLENPLFWIHLNIDHPFHLTGILFFPKITNQIEIQKDKIQLYKNQVYVTDNLDGIVPEFLTMLRGVIDSPDIPLNVSRSYLQTDSAVKKISNYITRKVADKLEMLFKNHRKDFEKKWEDIKTIIEYGMISNDKFFDKAKKFALYPNIEGEYFTFDTINEKIKDNQKDKSGKIKYLYASDKDSQYSYIQSAKEKGYEVLFLNSPLTSHFINKLESTYKNISFVRIDSDHIDKLIEKSDNKLSDLSEDDKKQLINIIENEIKKNNLNFTINLENCESTELPFIITLPEFMRRMKEMSFASGNTYNSDKFNDTYNLIVNINHDLIKQLLHIEDITKRDNLLKKALNLALISQNILRGKNLYNFISNEYKELNTPA